MVTVLLLGSLFALTPMYARSEAPWEWKTLKQGDITLEYQPMQENLAHDILPKLPNLVKAAVQRVKAGGMTATSPAITRRKECLQFIAHEIGLAKPGPNMTRIYDESLSGYRTFIASVKALHSFRLWFCDQLLDKL